MSKFADLLLILVSLYSHALEFRELIRVLLVITVPHPCAVYILIGRFSITYNSAEGCDVFPAHSEPQVRLSASHGLHIITESINTFVEIEVSSVT